MGHNDFSAVGSLLSGRLLVPRFTLFCSFRAAQIRQGKAQSAGNGLSHFQGLQRRIGVFGRLPSGKTTRGHLRCCAHLY